MLGKSKGQNILSRRVQPWTCVDDERKTDQTLNIIKIFIHNNTSKTKMHEPPHAITHASCLRYKAFVKYLYKRASFLEKVFFFTTFVSVLTQNFF